MSKELQSAYKKVNIFLKCYTKLNSIRSVKLIPVCPNSLSAMRTFIASNYKKELSGNLPPN